MNSSHKEKILEIMKKNSMHAYLATCDGDQPIVRSISTIVEEDMSVWLITSCSSRKVGQIKQNPKICLAFIEQPNGEKVAHLFGQAEIVGDMEQKKRVWNLVKNYDPSQYFPDGPESKDYCVLKINIKNIEWRDSWTDKMNVYEPTSG